MGFDLTENTVTLDFSKTRYKGLKVVLRPDAVSIADYLAYVELERYAERAEWLREHGAIAEWNLERSGQPVALDAEGVASLSPGLARTICTEFENAVVNVDAPLDPQSLSGDS